MPKMKSHSGASKRFRRTNKGRIKVKGANSRHILTKEPSKRKRQRRDQVAVSASDKRAVDRMLQGG